jgi:hypothetical protein
MGEQRKSFKDYDLSGRNKIAQNGFIDFLFRVIATTLSISTLFRRRNINLRI